MRAAVFEGLGEMGFEIDPAANAAAVGGRAGIISSENSRIRILVVPTDEELMIARETYRMVQ